MLAVAARGAATAPAGATVKLDTALGASASTPSCIAFLPIELDVGEAAGSRLSCVYHRHVIAIGHLDGTLAKPLPYLGRPWTAPWPHLDRTLTAH